MSVKKAAEAMAHLYVWDVVSGILEGAATPDRGGPRHAAACKKVLSICNEMKRHALHQYDTAAEKITGQQKEGGQ